MKKILIIDNDTNLLNQLLLLFSGQYHVKTMHYSQVSLNNIGIYDIIILSGGSNHSVLGNDEIYKTEIEIIRKSQIPVIGICLGFQLIAYAFNMKLKHLNKRRKGFINIKIIDFDFFAPYCKLQVYESHKFSVIKEEGWGGEEFDILAKSIDGIEAFKHKKRELYGFQFHPEMFQDTLKSDDFFLGLIKKILN